MDVAVDLAVFSVYDEVADIYDAVRYRTGTERREAKKPYRARRSSKKTKQPV